MVHYNGATNEGELKLGVTYTCGCPWCEDLARRDRASARLRRRRLQRRRDCGLRPALAGACGQAGCALLGPSYEQTNKDDCAGWADPRNGSENRFLQALADLAKQSHHPELEMVPWALWGHSVARVGLEGCSYFIPIAPLPFGCVQVRPFNRLKRSRSGVPVPVMCNLGTQEGVTVKTNRFAFMWGVVQSFFKEFRLKAVSSCGCGSEQQP